MDLQRRPAVGVLMTLLIERPGSWRGNADGGQELPRHDGSIVPANAFATGGAHRGSRHGIIEQRPQSIRQRNIIAVAVKKTHQRAHDPREVIADSARAQWDKLCSKQKSEPLKSVSESLPV